MTIFSNLLSKNQISPPRMKKKFALIVGFEYPNDKHNRRIMGPALSSKNFKQLLIDCFGFLPDDITYITDEDCSQTPTDEKILKELVEMVKKAEPFDTVVFLFCGHGGRYKGNYNNDSGFVEFLSTGTRPDGTQTYIRDYTLRQIVETVSKFISFTIIADTCNSGGLLEGANEVIGCSINNSITNKTRPPRNPFLNLGNPTGRPLGILISACQSDENTRLVFCTIQQKRVCYFTNTLISVVKRLGVNLSYKALVQEIKKVIVADGLFNNIHPGLYCDQSQMNLGFLSLEEVATEQVDSVPPTSQADRWFKNAVTTAIRFLTSASPEVFYAALRYAKGHAETAVVKLKTYNPEEHTFSLKISQEIPPTWQSVKEPMFIPIPVGLLDSTGKDIPPSSICHDGALLSVSSNDQSLSTTILRVTKKEKEFVFTDIFERPVPTLSRRYIAPIRLEADITFSLSASDSDKFNRFVDGFKHILSDSSLAKEFVEKAITLPGEGEIMDMMKVPDPDVVRTVRSFIMKLLVNGNIGEYVFDHSNMPKQAFAYLASIEDQEFTNLARQPCYWSLQEYKTAKNMTEQFAALTSVAQYPGKTHDYVLVVFNDKWKNDYLAVNGWYFLKAPSGIPGNIENMRKLLNHPAFDLRNPNKVYFLIGHFFGPPANFDAKDGSGYDFLGDSVLQLIKINPQGIDHIINSAAKSNYMASKQISVPIVFRGPNDAAAGVGAVHSRCCASWYGSCPGLKVLAPHSSEDARGLLKAAIRHPNHVVFLENELLYGEPFTVSAEVLDFSFCPRVGKAKIEREGKDVIVTAFSKMVAFALKAAETLVKEGISAEVINASVRETSRLVTVEKGLAVPQIEDIVRSAKRACHRSVPIAATA